MDIISIMQEMYNEVKVFADEKKVSVVDFVVSLIRMFIPSKNAHKRKYKMKTIEELSPVLQKILNMPRVGQIDDDNINGEKTREEYLREKYDLA